MTKRGVITEATIQAAFTLLEKRIAEPPPPHEKYYSRREAFLKLRAKAKQALSVGHSLETVLDDLKGIGLGLTISTAKQYLKPGRKLSKPGSVSQAVPSAKQAPQSFSKPHPHKQATNKGTFTVAEDDTEL